MKYTNNFFEEYRGYRKVPSNTPGNWEEVREIGTPNCVGCFGITTIRYIDSVNKVWRTQTIKEYYS